MAQVNYSSSSARPSNRDANTPNTVGFGNSHNTTSIADLVINSIPYQQAYAVFSAEPDKTWLQKLELIPYSVDDANATVWDSIGWSNKFEDKQDANYQYCMEQIRTLINDYHTWKNSLPTTQANQLSQIGYNSAITGEGISSSSVPSSGVSTNPSSLESTNAMDFVLNGAQFLLSATGGLADIAHKFATLGLNYKKTNFDMSLMDKNFVKEINTYAREHGITFSHDITSIKDFSRKGFQITDSEGKSINLEKLLGLGVNLEQYRPLISYALANDPDFRNIVGLGYMSDNSDYHGAIVDGVTYSNPKAIPATIVSQFKLLALRVANEAYKDKYSKEILQYSADSAEYKSLSDKYNVKQAEYNKETAEIKIDLIRQLARSSDPTDLLYLSKILYGINEDDIKILSTSREFIESEKALGIIAPIIKLLQGGK